MVILLVPSLDCSFRCVYCFEKKRRMNVDVDAMKRTLQQLMTQMKGSHICLHGGEATLADTFVFEELVHEASKYTNSVGLQTCGYYLTDEILDIIVKYRMNVGVSIDGSLSQNILRGEHPLNRRYAEKMTKRVMENI